MSSKPDQDWIFWLHHGTLECSKKDNKLIARPDVRLNTVLDDHIVNNILAVIARGPVSTYHRLRAIKPMKSSQNIIFPSSAE